MYVAELTCRFGAKKIPVLRTTCAQYSGIFLEQKKLFLRRAAQTHTEAVSHLQRATLGGIVLFCIV